MSTPAPVLVTGATGFIGPHVAHALRAREVPVRALVRDLRSGARLAAWGVELVVGDVTDPASVRAALSGVDSVVHLVAIIKGAPADFDRIMTQGTRGLVAAAQDVGVRRFVLASALGLDERSKDVVPYYAAKWEMERAVKESGLEYVILRPSFVFGKHGGVLPTFVRLARFAPVTPIVGPGTQRLQPIWVDDVAEYYARSIDLPAAANRTFEIGGPDTPTWNEFWDRLKRVLGARRPSIHVPFAVMRVQATLLERLPGAPVTRDQLKMLELGDNVVTDAAAVEAFELPLVPLDEQLRRAAS
jgi:NADH dehydrogenase